MKTIPLLTPGWTLEIQDHHDPIWVRKEIMDVGAWTAALRSGFYTQTQGILHHAINGLDSYCCLGVLCKIQRRPFTVENPTGNNLLYIYDKNSSTLSDNNPANKKLKLDGNGRLPHNVELRQFEAPDHNRLCVNLADANDRGLCFKDIATVIDNSWTNQR